MRSAVRHCAAGCNLKKCHAPSVGVGSRVLLQYCLNLASPVLRVASLGCYMGLGPSAPAEPLRRQPVTALCCRGCCTAVCHWPATAPGVQHLCAAAPRSA